MNAIEKKLNDEIRRLKSDFYVVQIGANDGSHVDHIFNQIKNHKMSAVLVEPVKHLFERLKQNYGNVSNLHFENSAIGKETGTIDFYQFPEHLESDPGFPKWATGMGSILEPFNSAGHANLKKKNFQMEKVKTSSLTLEDLIKKYNIQKIDLLQIDAEGYDGEILSNLSETSIKPKFIRYEDKHINTVFKQNMVEMSSSDLEKFLVKLGYEVSEQNPREPDRVCMLT